MNNKGSLNDNMIDISNIINNLKFTENSIEKEIENEELYKEKIIEKLEECKNEMNKIQGIIFYNFKIL